MNANRKLILEALEEDARCRVPGVTAGVYTLADLHAMGEFCRLTSGFPVFACDTDRDSKTKLSVNKVAISATNEVFAKRLDWEAPWLSKFPFKEHDMVIAGPCAAALLMLDNDKHRCRHYDCVRVYLLSKCEADAKKAIIALGEHLYKWGDGTTEVRRFKNQIRFTHPKHRRINIFLTQYSTKAEILHSMAVGSSAVLWDGEELLMSRLGMIAVRHGANVLNLSVPRRDYEDTVETCFHHGFDFVVPGFDLSAIEGNDCIKLPFLEAQIERIEGCVVHCRSMKQLPDESDKSFDTPLHRNLYAISKGDPDDLMAYAVYSPDVDIFTLGVDLSGIGAQVRELFGDGTSVNLHRVNEMFGQHGTAWLVAACIKTPSMPEADLATIAKQMHSYYTTMAPDGIPFRLLPVDQESLTNEDPRTAEEWLGPYRL